MNFEHIEQLHVLVDEPMPIRQALEMITDQWVDDDNGSAQTLIDLRDACRKLIETLDSIQVNPVVTIDGVSVAATVVLTTPED